MYLAFLVHSPAAAHVGHRSSPSTHSPPHLAAWNSVDLPNSPTCICTSDDTAHSSLLEMRSDLG